MSRLVRPDAKLQSRFTLSASPVMLISGQLGAPTAPVKEAATSGATTHPQIGQRKVLDPGPENVGRVAIADDHRLARLVVAGYHAADLLRHTRSSETLLADISQMTGLRSRKWCCPGQWCRGLRQWFLNSKPTPSGRISNNLFSAKLTISKVHIKIYVS
jgi:hypothetical protein